MDNTTLLAVLSVFTLVAVVGVALYQKRSVRHSQAKRGELPEQTGDRPAE